MNLNNATEIIARREFSPVYMIFDVAFLLCFAAMLSKKEIYDGACRRTCGNTLYDSGLRDFSSCLPFEKHIRGAQPFSCAFMDVDKLWVYEFYLDMALDI